MKFTPAKDTLKLANDKREEIAKTVFDYARVAELITAAAAAGENGLQVIQEQPLDLRNTTYGKTLKNKLQEAGYSAQWIEATQKEILDGKETGVFLLYYELLIKWGKVNRRGIQNEAPE